MKRFNRSILALAAAALPISLAALSGMAQEGKKPAKPMLASQKYKNIKVLKNLPADQLGPLMHKYNDSLGVRCDFCHVINPDHTGWELDDKPAKLKAREMITMTQNLNKKEKSVNGQITCYLCHRGKPEPESQIPAKQEEKK